MCVAVVNNISTTVKRAIVTRFDSKNLSQPLALPKMGLEKCSYYCNLICALQSNIPVASIPCVILLVAPQCECTTFCPRGRKFNIHPCAHLANILHSFFMFSLHPHFTLSVGRATFRVGRATFRVHDVLPHGSEISHTSLRTSGERPP